MRKLATTKGKKFAINELNDRRILSESKGQKNNSMLPAGSPMYFYCKSCGLVSDILPESYMCTPKKLCDECQALKDLDWLE